MEINFWEIYTNWNYPIITITVILFTIVSMGFAIYGFQKRTIQTAQAIFMAGMMLIVLNETIKTISDWGVFENAIKFIIFIYPIMFVSIVSLPGLLHYAFKKNDQTK